MKLPKGNIKLLAGNTFKHVAKYRVLIFVILIGSVYGYVLFTISTLSNVEPSQDTVNSELSAIKTPRIDESVVKQLKTLRDNSVSVQALFEQARDNPFNE